MLDMLCRLIGEYWLRWKTGKWSGRVTTPVLLTPDGKEEANSSQCMLSTAASEMHCCALRRAFIDYMHTGSQWQDTCVQMYAQSKNCTWIAGSSATCTCVDDSEYAVQVHCWTPLTFANGLRITLRTLALQSSSPRTS